MTRRRILASLLAAPQLRGQPSLQAIEWQEFAIAWNPFAEKLNAGVFDVKLWNRVRAKFHQIDKSCKED